MRKNPFSFKAIFYSQRRNQIKLSMLFLLFGPIGALAQTTDENSFEFTRPIKIVVPFSAGGITDTQTRTLAQKLGQRLGQAVIVENKPGASGSVGTMSVLSGRNNDGYTYLLGASGTIYTNAVIYPNHRKTLESIVPVHGIAASPITIAIAKNRPYKNFPEFVEYAKKNPGKINLGTAGSGTGTSLVALDLEKKLGISLAHISYSGSAPAINALIAGQVDVVFDYMISLLPHSKSGSISLIGITTQEESSIAKEVPSISKYYKGYDMYTFTGIFAPGGTPGNAVRRISSEISEIMKEPDYKKSLESVGSVPMVNMANENFSNFIKEQRPRWIKISEEAGVAKEQ